MATRVFLRSDEEFMKDREKDIASLHLNSPESLGKGIQDNDRDLLKKKSGLEGFRGVNLPDKFKWNLGYTTENGIQESITQRDPQLALRSTEKVQDVRRSREALYNDLLEEYRQLPSPVRSSLRSPGKSPTRLKEGFRVTFADNTTLDSASNGTVKPAWTSTAQTSVSNGTERSFASRESQTAKSAKMADTDEKANNLKGGSLLEKPYQTPFTNLLKSQINKTDADVDADKAKNLEPGLSSKYLDPTPIYSADRVSSRQGLGDRFSSFPLNSFTFPSTEELLKKPLTWSQEKTQRNRPQYQSSSSSIRRTGSLNSLLTKLEQRAPVVEVSENLDNPVPHSTSPLPISNILSVLKQLLDLVDRHWNGSKSLHQNHEFLTPAHDLLAGLSTSASVDSQQIKKLEQKIQELTEENRSLKSRPSMMLNSLELQKVRLQLTETEDDLEALKTRLADVVQENNNLRMQIMKTELNSSSSLLSPGMGTSQKMTDLTVSQQVKHFGRLEEAMNMLRESHRSLVSTNDYLLQRLSKSGEPASHPLDDFSSKAVASRRATGSPPLASATRVSQYSRLSTCPI
ncbi:leucine-rich repeat-containing protein 36-like [Erpetoichthys calabaricus]|uniref:leucine-rich repeat-containing protein 36-like n=1 Tax=Erpetoichthys calabaricus TaxID=27687 RepID=UPI00109FBDD0|nr:leucine-rich repeat-containing protein 36-like [Erpetoichthys calabaricus]